jgi:predicted component of type VI protein secretion system
MIEDPNDVLRQMAINDGLRNKPIKQMLDEKDRQIAVMAQLLDEAMRVFKAYVNVPEANALRERWGKLKSELGP